jgi:transcriptional regulator with XRE-family HTH domain
MEGSKSNHRLIAVREQRMWTQEEAAEQVGVDPQTYWRWENGIQRPRPYALRKLSAVFGVAVEDLGFGRPWKEQLDPAQPAEEALQVTNTQDLPGDGESMYSETLNVIEHLIQQAWYLRRVAPKTETEKTTKRLREFFQYCSESLPPPPFLERRFLQLYAQVQRLNAIMQIENQHYHEALATFLAMHHTAKQLDDPSTLALALMGIGTELERAGRQQEAVERLEEARDVSFNASRQVAGVVNAYLARAYASSGDAFRFNRAIDTAQNIAAKLGESYGDGTDYVFHRLSGILAERSYGYLELHEPKKTLDLKDEITRQIDLTHNTWLHAWIPLDWARAYLLLNEIEESVKAGREFFHRTLALQSPHAISRAYQHLIALEGAGYADLAVVRDLRDELVQHSKETNRQLPPPHKSSKE